MLQRYLVNGGAVEPDGTQHRLWVPPTPDTHYVDAQLDDYAKALPMRFTNRPPQQLRVRARFSHPAGALKGTAGFGFWNHPFGQEGQLLASPCNVWFFYGSPESDLQVMAGGIGHGFKAATLSSPPLPSGGGRLARLVNRWLDRLLQRPALARLMMSAAQRMVRASEARLDAENGADSGLGAGLDLTQWHNYEIDWRRDLAIFRVDGRMVLQTDKVPAGPLGFVAWIDNYKAIAADGRYQFGYLALAEAQWLELSIERSESSDQNRAIRSSGEKW